MAIHTPTKDQPVTPQTFHFAINRKKLRAARRREGGYLLRTNINGDDPGHLWRLYLQLGVIVDSSRKSTLSEVNTLPSRPAAWRRGLEAFDGMGQDLGGRPR